MRKLKADLLKLLLTVVLVIIAFPSCSLDMLLQQDSAETDAGVMTPEIVSRIDYPDVEIYPEYDGSSELFFIQMHDDIPYFTDMEYEYAEAKGNFIELSELDSLRRTGVTWGLFSFYTMPTEDREGLDTKPSGWVQNRYESDIVDGGWLYNRAHQLGFQISGLNDVPENLMTGTRVFNVEGMLPFENMVADHLKEEHDHEILYRVSPYFEDDNLLASGMLMESDCLDCDDSADFCVFIFNVQPGITIDYSTGENWLSTELPPEDDVAIDEATYILNTNSKIFHVLGCSKAPSSDSKNYKLTDMSYDEAVEAGYTPCEICKPHPVEQIPEIVMSDYTTIDVRYILSMPA